MQTRPQNCLIREPAVGTTRPTAVKAFTLLELLVVLVIMGILAAIGLPAIRGMSKSNAIAAADRQMLDDLAYARQRAIAEHTTVYMVFVPPFAGFSRPADKIFKIGNFPTDEWAVVSN